MSDLKIFTDNIEPEALNQIYTLVKQPVFADCKVRIMPDVHAGAGCVIGFTADLGDKVIPNIVGVDIGCGMRTVEILLIPINMRDGCIIGKGKGNPDWNCSAPHGAGRIMSRSKAKELVSLADFEDSMKGIFTTSVSQSTIDESPMIYKPMAEIVANIAETVDILMVIKPLYNYKASE